MSSLEYHVLLALAGHRLHGYAIKDAVSAESGGTLAPAAGSLYRVLARLMSSGWVTEVSPGAQAVPHPGLARRYYALTGAGKKTLLAEADRLKRTASMAQRRLDVARSRS